MFHFTSIIISIILHLSPINNIEEQKYFSDFSRKKLELFHGDQKYRNDKFILPDVVLYFSCYDSAMDDDSNSRNVTFYFFNDKC